MKRRQVKPIQDLGQTAREFVQELRVSTGGVHCEEITRKIRKLLAIDGDPPIQEFIAAGAVSVLARVIVRSTSSTLHFEAAWVLTNLASGNMHQTHRVIEQGIVVIFVHLLNSLCSNVCDQAIWGLGNIAGCCHECRDIVLRSGIIQHLLKIEPNTHLSYLRNGLWVVSNLFRKHPKPEWDLISQLFPLVFQFLMHDDAEVICNAAWAISYVAAMGKEGCQTIIDSNLVPRLIELIVHSSRFIQVPILESIRYIALQDAQFSRPLIDAGLLQNIGHAINHSSQKIEREAHLIIVPFVVDRVLMEEVIRAGVIDDIMVRLRALPTDHRAYATLIAMFKAPSPTQLRYLLDRGAIQILCHMITRFYFVPQVLAIIRSLRFSIMDDPIQRSNVVQAITNLRAGGPEELRLSTEILFLLQAPT
eukprot:TRINITY_DN9749_c0_g1_i1.p1 TRINITY_DN9749_c0_g1~~TRINITY_DN9749_c0_g1_i1.p1  ORF type:complete len:419 (+),score=68.77 TRINITY_DN9749_c0_g1_i1:83-1339(+)